MNVDCDSSWIVSTNAMDDAMHLVETMSAKSDAKPNVVTFTTLGSWLV